MNRFIVRSGKDVKQARKEMGMSVADLRDALRLSVATGGETIRKWERGKIPVTGPASVAIELLVHEYWDAQDDFD